MNILIIYNQALSMIDMANLKELNREHHPVTVVVVDNYGQSKRYKVKDDLANTIADNTDPSYIICK